MFRALDTLQRGYLPPIQEHIPQAKTTIHSYITLQTDSTTKTDTFIRPEKPSISIPKYSWYAHHTQSKENKAAAVKAAVEDKKLYSEIINPPIVTEASVNYSKLPALSDKLYMSSILVDGSSAKPVALSVVNIIDEPLKLRTTSVVARDLRTLDSYSFCAELQDSSKGPFPQECIDYLSKQFGKTYPGDLTGLPTWEKVKEAIANYTILPVAPSSIRYIGGMEIMWFNTGTNTYIDRITEFKGSMLNTEGVLVSTMDYFGFIYLRPPKDITVTLRFLGGKIMATEKGPVQYMFELKTGKPNCILAKWEDLPKTHVVLEYSESGGVFKDVPREWISLSQEPNAPIFSWEGRRGKFEEVRLPGHMALTMNRIKLVETDVFPVLLQLRTGSHSGFAVVQRNITTNSWRTITCCFLSASGQGILFTFGPLSVVVVGKHVRFQWTSATLDVQHTFENVLALDSNTPYLASVNMRSDLENIFPNRITFYIASFTDWRSGRVTTEKFGNQGATFITAKQSALYSETDSAQLCIGNAVHSANAAVAWIRIFDYEHTSVDAVRDTLNSWERV
jgi:hypothetical protein